jgi:predicted transcriptional regulator YdeE
MDFQIIDKSFSVSIYGFAGTTVNNNWTETGFRLMNKMWERVRALKLPNKGMNIWIYEENNKLFAGVELDSVPQTDSGLEFKRIDIAKYAYYKHIGPYHLIKSKGSQVLAELKKRGIETAPLYIEIYGHWTNDETKLETELIWSLK